MGWQGKRWDGRAQCWIVAPAVGVSTAIGGYRVEDPVGDDELGAVLMWNFLRTLRLGPTDGSRPGYRQQEVTVRGRSVATRVPCSCCTASAVDNAARMMGVMLLPPLQRTARSTN